MYFIRNKKVINKRKQIAFEVVLFDSQFGRLNETVNCYSTFTILKLNPNGASLLTGFLPFPFTAGRTDYKS